MSRRYPTDDELDALVCQHCRGPVTVMTDDYGRPTWVRCHACTTARRSERVGSVTYPYPSDSRCWHCDKPKRLQWHEQPRGASDVVGAWLCRACLETANEFPAA